jgi:NAD(P)-dependent dehydrogenase (short-subunit alcohol dehydrogenase family)
MNISGAAVLITGGARIGATVAVELACRGADIALSYRHSRERAAAAARAVRVAGRRAELFHADLEQPESAHALVDAVIETFGRLDVLVAMASRYVQTPFETLTVDAWRAAIDCDLSASFYCASAAARHMRARKAGRIICVADTDAASGRPKHKNFLPYFVAKSGVIALSRALALELAGDGVLVNTIALGPMLPGDDATDDENRTAAESVPMGRWGGSIEVAKAVGALIETDFITGEVVRVDGGCHLA